MKPAKDCPDAMEHAKDCPQYIARRGAIPVECPHGYDCCPECDPCTCGKDRSQAE